MSDTDPLTTSPIGEVVSADSPGPSSRYTVDYILGYAPIELKAGGVLVQVYLKTDSDSPPSVLIETGGGFYPPGGFMIIVNGEVIQEGFVPDDEDEGDDEDDKDEGESS
jgi:hypothetical protein